MAAPDQARALARLDAEQSRVEEQLAGLRRGFQEMVDASAGSNADDEHDPEGSTIAFERSQLSAMIHQAERHLGDISDARRRATDGGYGVCQTCDGPISAARLGALPAARTCISCATSR